MFNDKKKLPKTTTDEPKLVFETPHTSRRDETRLTLTSKSQKPSSFVASAGVGGHYFMLQFVEGVCSAFWWLDYVDINISFFSKHYS